ncbi:MAG: FtsX-like permease family protein [Actinomycetota bacterium]
MIRAIRLRGRAELRSSWRAWLALALLFGTAGGAATAAAAGARRTETAYPRFVEWGNAPDVLTGGFEGKLNPEKVFATIEHLPSVLAWARQDLVAQAIVLPDGRTATAPEIFGISDLEGRLGVSIDRTKVLSGRMFDRAATDEAVVDFTTADRYGIHVGSVLGMIVGDPAATSRQVARVRVVGVVATPASFPAIGNSTFATVALSPGYAPSHGIHPHLADSGLLLRLRGGAAGFPRFERELRTANLLGRVDIPETQTVRTAGVQKTIGLEAASLWSLAGLIALAAFTILGQALARQTHLDAREFPTLRALGMSRRQLLGLGIARAVAIGLAAAVVAVPVAVLLSPLTPIGLARIAEPDPGFLVDPAALAIGAFSVLLLTPLVAAIPAWRAARSAASATGRTDRERPSALTGAAARRSSSPTVGIGVRMALEPGRGATAVPVRSAILGTTLAIAALVASLMFWTSLRHLLETPRLSGYTWDVFVASDHLRDEARIASTLKHDAGVAGYTRGGFVGVRIAGSDVFGVLTGGATDPVIVAGRAPRGPGEVALGSGSLRAAHARIGDTVQVGPEATGNRVPPARAFRVVGEIIVPPSPFGVTGTGEGAALAFQGLARLYPEEATPQARHRFPFLVKFVPGADPEATLARLQPELPPGTFVVPAGGRGDLPTLGRIAQVPLALAALLALLAAGTLAQTLVTSVRRRRRDLAVLKTLGFVQRQVRGTVAWQATILAAVSLVLGLPVGLALGRWAWLAFADSIGVIPAVAIGLLPLALTAIGTVALANLVAAVPARVAASTHPAAILRTE